MTPAEWTAVRERAWVPIDPDRRCWTCGREPSSRYPDGSPRYDCRHEPAFGQATPAIEAAWASMIAQDLVTRKDRRLQNAVAVRRRSRAQAHARASDPSTSHAAAASIRSAEITELQIWILDVLESPLSDEQIWNELTKRHPGRLTPSGVRTRRSELVDDGRILDSGRKTSTAAGRKSIVWIRADQKPSLAL